MEKIDLGAFAKGITIAVIMLIVGLCLFGWGLSIGLSSPKAANNSCLKEAAKKVEDSNLFIMDKQPLNAITGKITKIENGKLYLEAANLMQNPLAESTPKERAINYDDTIKISLQQNKSPETMNADMAKFNKEMAAFSKDPKIAPPMPPMPFEIKTISPSELKTGVSVMIMSSEDIRYAKEVKASEIRIINP